MDWADDTAYSINDLSDAILLKYVTVPDLEAWAGKQQTLDTIEQEQIAFLIDTIRQGKVEGRLARGIGENIRACSLRPSRNFLSEETRRHALELVIDEAVLRKTKLNKRIAFELIFDTHRLHQLDFKAEGVINRMFEVLEERYVQRSGRPSWHLLPEPVEEALEKEDDTSRRARLVCDWLANLTDRSAWERHQRLFDTSAGATGKFL
jgi:dGTPase